MENLVGPRTVSFAAPTRLRARSLSLGATCVMLAALTAGVVFVPHVAVIALIAILVGSFIAYMRLRPDRQNGDLLEVIIPISVLNFLYFGVGTLYMIFSPQATGYPSLEQFVLPATAVAVLGCVCFLVGYGWSARTTAPSPLGKLVPTNVMVYLLPAVAGTLGMSATKFQLQSMLADDLISAPISALQQFGFMFYFGWFLAWYMTWAGRIRLSAAVPLLGALTVMAGIIIQFNFGGKALAAVLLFMPAMAYYEVKRKIPVKSALVVGLIFVFVVFPMFNTYRAQSRTLDMSRRLDRTVDVARTWNSSEFMDVSLFAFLDRLTAIRAMSAVISDTGRWVDYRYGETLILAPIGLLVPRFLWPSKPSISIGKEFGATFRMTASLDRETEIAPTLIGDFYWNFSVPGVIVGMWLLGMGNRWFYQRFGAGGGFDPIRKSIYATLLPAAIMVEDNVAIITAGFVKNLVILVVFLFLLRRIGWLKEIQAP